MARTHYTVTFPAARPGANVTWPDNVKVYPDASSQMVLKSGQTLNESLAFSGWSESASIAFTVGDETLTVTTGAPTATGADPTPTGGSVPVADRAQYYGPNQVVTDPADGSGFGMSLPWEFTTGVELLDLTDPQFPTVLEAGVYAVTANVVRLTTAASGVANAQMYGDLTLDHSGESAIASGTCPLDVSGVSSPKAQVSLSLTHYVAAGGQIQVGCGFPGSVGNQTLNLEVMIQRLA